MIKKCGKYYGEMTIGPYTCSVTCERPLGHLGMHASVPMGRFVEWIENDRKRGIAKASGDERAVKSPSDFRNKETKLTTSVQPQSWWKRLLYWFMDLVS